MPATLPAASKGETVSRLAATRKLRCDPASPARLPSFVFAIACKQEVHGNRIDYKYLLHLRPPRLRPPRLLQQPGENSGLSCLRVLRVSAQALFRCLAPRHSLG